MTARFIAAFALSVLAVNAAEVKVWQGTLRLPTYEEGAPDPNPPFDVFATQRFNYPYALRENLTSRRIERDWRALILENEYLKCFVLPDVGGHLYSCTDKISGREMFYANPSLKKARVGYRGAWSAFGIEFNFPVSHNWMSMSPVDFAITKNSDGSASAWVGNTDRPYGMRWVVELKLRPGSTVLEQRMRLSNPSPVRHRFYWWNNAGVEVWNDSRIWYPMRWTASHGFTQVDTWPVNQAGLDLSVVGNHTAGPVSQFAHGTREPYMGVYHPKTNTGTVHYADYAEVPFKKIWAWGVDPDGLDWRKALSDNESAYVEIQGGLFRNQETYSFLNPNERLEFSEYWMPVREIGGISRANLHGVVYIDRAAQRVSLNVNHPVQDATVRLRDGERVLATERTSLTPEKVWTRAIPPDTAKLTFEMLDAAGKPLLTHTEGVYDFAPESEIKVGRQPQHAPAPEAQRTDGGWLEAAVDDELNGRKLEAMTTYEQGLKRYPDSIVLQRGAGRLAVDLERYEDAVRWLSAVQQRISNDPDAHYYLGLAHMALSNMRTARNNLEAAYRTPEYCDAARVRLGSLAAREERWSDAVRYLAGTPLELSILRRTGADRIDAVRRWTEADPTDSFVRLERGLDDALLRHLAAEPERVLEIASRYMQLGFWADALALLERKYPSVDEAEREPGTVLPQDHPLVSYYRGYVRSKLGQSPVADWTLASKQRTRYVFPNRALTLEVLRAVLDKDPKDATAHFLLGSLRMAGGQVDAALKEWQQARALNPKLPVLHRNIARTLLELKHDATQAAEVYRDGLSADPDNLEVYSGLTQSLALLGRPAAERVAVLERYPQPAAMPAPLVYDLALSLAEAGRFEDAERLFRGRFFAREEGGTNVRQVWLEVQLAKALAHPSADAVRALGEPVAGVDFTRDGMSAFTRSARFHYLAGVAAEKAGDRALAENHWKQAAEQAQSPQIAYAYAAAKRLPGFQESEWKPRLESALERAPEAWRGTVLLALGRKEEAARAFESAIYAPDRGLSRYIARVELARAR